MTRAFEAGAQNEAVFLTYSGVRLALEILGLAGSCGAERDAISLAVRKIAIGATVTFFVFVCDIVPKAMQAIRGIRNRQFMQEFCLYDTNNSNDISQASCLKALRNHAQQDDMGMDEEAASTFMEIFSQCFNEIC